MPSIGRVFVNLIENAIHHTPSGGKIIMLVHQIERQVEIRIIDTGVGIATDELERILDRFWRGDRWRSLPEVIAHPLGRWFGLSIGSC
ncbi:ATP-binding protein [Chamaesiphon minutus]|uniref:ATP-binding protein n=1 Tax=Chamaesiphon minutus TaxID=1173032 RepID=UPI000B34A39C|nr:sensor histidine kinase [Chamaesiphon minutus]